MNPILASEFLVPLAAILVVAGLALAWRSTRGSRPRVRWGVFACRLVTLAAVALLAFNPGGWRDQREEKNGRWAILVDRSSSMIAPDGNESGATRWNEAIRLAGKALEASGDPKKVEVFTFSANLEDAVPDTATLANSQKPDGAASNLRESGSSLLQRLGPGGDLTGALLLTDGRQTGPDNPGGLALHARALEAKLFALPLGGEVPVTDLVLEAGRRRYIAFPGQKLRVRATASANGLGAIAPTLRLFSVADNATPLAEQKVEIAADGSASHVFEITGGEAGYHAYHLEADTFEGERSTTNNRADFGISVIDGRIKVFTAEGVPYWDSKFLVQLLRNQPNIEVTSIYRLSGDRFFRVESDPAQAAESDESNFPDTPEALAAFDVVVLGKGAEYFLNPERVNLLKNFVRDQGGALVFSRGKPYAGTFEELEVLEPVDWGEELAGGFHFSPTADGGEAGLFGDMLAGPDDPLWRELPPLVDARRVKQNKAFAQTLVEGVPEGGRPFPAVISRRYGKGMTLAVNADGMWRWDFFPAVENAANMYQEFWTQVIQWTVTYSDFLPGQDYALRLSETAVLPTKPVRATLLHRTPTPDAPAPKLRILRDGKEEALLETRLAEGTDGRWECVVTRDTPGEYRLEVVPADDSPAPGAALSVLAPPGENDNLSADRAYLEKLATESGGRLVGEDDLAEVARELDPTARSVDLKKATWEPAWDRGWILGLLLFFPTLEWFIRRRNGLL